VSLKLCGWGLILLYALFCPVSRAQTPGSWHSEKGFRWAELDVPKTGKTRFTLLNPAETGVTFTNRLEEWEGAANRVLYNGSGVAVGDFDNDGLPDIFLTGLNSPNALFKNLGHWKFKDVTKEAGLAFTNKYYRGTVFADINGDGFLDLLIATTGQGVLYFENDGKGHFTDKTQSAGTGSKSGSVTLALADVDGNGTLDLYVANNRSEDIRDRGQVDIGMVRGKLAIPPWFRDRLLIVNGQLFEFGEPDQLFLNDGKGHFTAASWTNGMFLNEEGIALSEPPRDWGLTATFRDMNGDGAPDLYVCNDYWTPDRIWMNDGHGHFRAIPRLALRNTSASSMGVDFADLDRDGHYDFLVVDMLSRDTALRKRQTLAQTPMGSAIGAIDNRPQFMRNTLFHNLGDGMFEEIANFAGVPASEWSWSPVFIDVDLDGYEDLLITTGHAKDVQDIDAANQMKGRQPNFNGVTNAAERQRIFTQQKLLNGRLYPRLDTPIVAFHNLKNLRFEEVTSSWGTGQPGIHHGMALADFDNDGDLDFVVNNLGGVAGIYRNETVAPRVAVRLRGLAPNTQGIGATVKLLNGAIPMQSQEVVSGGRYMSGFDPMLTFAAGTSQGGMSIEVRWRSGKSTVVRDVGPNRIYEIDESSSAPMASSAKPSLKPIFRDVSERLTATHHDEPFDDFERQPFLPKKLSQLGPGLAWYDVDHDGWDDLILGSGRGGKLAVFRNDQKGCFARLHEPPLDQVVTRDQSGVVAWSRPNGEVVILAGSANYEDGLDVGSVVRQFDLGAKALVDQLPGQASTSGPLALGDIDGDGDLDLFVGGRCLPGRYPEPASSMLFRNENGRWVADAANNRVLQSVGLVSGAVWSDLDGDGFPELILACEWGPVRVFKNNAGKLAEITTELGLAKQTGWWAGVTTADLDGDGRPDIIASNWGLNSPYRASAEKPLRLCYADFAGRGTVDLIETEYDWGTGALVPSRNMNALSSIIPSLPDRFATHKAYSAASLDAVLGEQKSQVHSVEAVMLSSMIFLNRTNRFDPVDLPREAQLAPAFAVTVADFDGDGAEDVFLSQNFFATQPELPRLDAGRGLLLRGKGTGQFEALSAEQSGLRIYGEQRAAVAGDFNHDGRVDLAVSQNGASTRLFENATAKPGIRIRLNAGPGNPFGVGAALRLVFQGGRMGPLREIRAGSGYWSQDSAIQVMSVPEEPTAVWVRWPGGKITTSPVGGGARELQIDSKGQSSTITP